MKLIGNFWSKAFVMGLTTLVIACGSDESEKQEANQESFKPNNVFGGQFI